MKSIMLFDGNAIGNHFHHTTVLSVGDFQTQAIFGFLRQIQRLCVQRPLDDLIVLWDGRAQFRFELLPTYKEGREKDVPSDPDKAKRKAAYRAQRPFIEKAVGMLGVKQMTASNLEADDLAGHFARQFDEMGWHVRLVTGDSDWLQLVSERVSWLDPRGDGKEVWLHNFLEMTGYHTPREYLEGKALIGDTTDDIPPAGGIGKKGAPEFMAQFGSVSEFWRRCDAGEFKPTAKKHLNLWKGEARKNFERNLQLMDLTTPRPFDMSKLSVSAGDLRLDAFKLLCERLYFQSILNDFDNFTKPFEERWTRRQVIPKAA